MAAVLAIVFLIAILLDKTYRAVPAKELRRRARGGADKNAQAVYKMAAYGPTLELFLWLLGAASAASLLIILEKSAWWSVLLVFLAASWFMWLGQPLKKYGSWAWKAAGLAAPLVSGLLSYLQPALGRLGRRRADKLRVHTDVYEKEDLLELLDKQARQTDNRLSDTELNIAKAALTFGDKTVSSIMTPRGKVKWVAASEVIGPTLMDELHKTGFSRFPVVKEVVKSGNPEVVGTLYIKDLLENLEQRGHIRDLMRPKAHFINESDTLRQALDAFMKSGHHLLIAVNNFEEVVGMLAIENVIEQILGEKLADDFDQYDSLLAVAGHDPQQMQEKHHTEN